MTNKIKNLLNLIKQTLYSKFLTNKNIFYYIYKNNFWKYKESRSGQGSQGEYLDFTVNLVKEEKKIIGKTVCDIGCGDFNFGSLWYDTVFDAKVQINDRGWSLEMIIPYSAID